MRVRESRGCGGVGVVEGLQVAEDRVGQLHAGLASLAVEQLKPAILDPKHSIKGQSKPSPMLPSTGQQSLAR